ncbi:5'-AMP-activated protein kinase beta subunit, interation domain-containing protein [Lipomyces tetrasporus]
MGNSTSQERPPEAPPTEEQSTAGSSVTSPQDTSSVDFTHDSSNESGSYFKSQDVTADKRAKSIKSIVHALSSESLDSLPNAQHREIAADDGINSEAVAQHAENIVDDIQFQRLKLGENVEPTDSDRPAEEAAVTGKPVSKMLSGEEIDISYGEPSDQTVPTLISWVHGGKKVYVTGTFTGWRKMIKLTRNGNEFSTVVNLPPGTHRIRFVVDNELRCSDALPTATDSMGNLVNYIEVSSLDLPSLEREGQLDEEKFEDTVSIPPLEYTSEIPEIFTNPEATERYISEDYPAPPYLPPHLETVILNTNSTEKDDSSVLPIPNHVVLNHLATTSIKHNVLAVASVSRYARKYVTQILYAPL